MSEFHETLAALKEVDLEETGGQCASDAAYWAVGDALVEECGDPVWDEDLTKCTFKGGSKLREAARWLSEHGLENYQPWSGSFAYDLYTFREASERFPPNTRKLNVTYNGHCSCDDLEELNAV